MKEAARRLSTSIFALLTITAALHAQDLASFEKRTTVRKLDNGLTVIAMERPEATAFSSTTIVNTGSAQEVPVTKPKPDTKPAVAATAIVADPVKPKSSSPEGLALIKKVQSFAGGKAKIDAVVATHSLASMQAQGPQGPMDVEIESIVKYPDYSHRVVKTPMGEIKMITTPDGAYMSGPMGEQDMPASQRATMRNESRADIISVLKNIDNPKYIFTVAGTEKVGTTDAQALTVDADGASIKWLVDPTSGKILRRVSQSPRGEAVTDYTEWKTFDGITLPISFTTTTAGQPNGKGTLKSMEINPTIDPKMFEKPVN